MSAKVLVCPQCRALNRVPAEKLSRHPQCGKCKAALLPGTPVDVDAAGLAKFLARSELPVVVDFWAPWCGPCRAMAPAYAAAARALDAQAVLLKVDTQAEQQAGAAHAIQAIPTMAIFRGGREIARQSGAIPEQAIVGWVRGQLG